MKIKFRITEKLYRDITFEVECESQAELEEVLDEIGERVNADTLCGGLLNAFGDENVFADGIDDDDSIQFEDEYEFMEWIED